MVGASRRDGGDGVPVGGGEDGLIIGSTGCCCLAQAEARFRRKMEMRTSLMIVRVPCDILLFLRNE